MPRPVSLERSLDHLQAWALAARSAIDPFLATNESAFSLIMKALPSGGNVSSFFYNQGPASAHERLALAPLLAEGENAGEIFLNSLCKRAPSIANYTPFMVQVVIRKNEPYWNPDRVFWYLSINTTEKSTDFRNARQNIIRLSNAIRSIPPGGVDHTIRHHGTCTMRAQTSLQAAQLYAKLMRHIFDQRVSINQVQHKPKQ